MNRVIWVPTEMKGYSDTKDNLVLWEYKVMKERLGEQVGKVIQDY